jgi:DNA-binding IclR family transcriptional regulator
MAVAIPTGEAYPALGLAVAVPTARASIEELTKQLPLLREYAQRLGSCY